MMNFMQKVAKKAANYQSCCHFTIIAHHTRFVDVESRWIGNRFVLIAFELI